ncbi:Ff.00g034200.m01.CDS01 [Fusarium sp. VM40]|nr:Ff.00g034200.m01.CDS01 [Fusarium sp. VM40]
MDYCTSSLKPFSANEVWEASAGDDTKLVFSHTTIVAVQNHQVYQGTSKNRLEGIDKTTIIKQLSPIPREDIYPPCPPQLTRAPEIYIKVPDLKLYSPERKGIIAQRLLHEAGIYQTLREHPHPNLGQSLGCVVGRDGLLQGLALFKYKTTLFEMAHDVSFELGQRDKCITAIKSALDHLHTLGLAHNDLSPLNIMFTDDGEPVLLDFDTCHPIGMNLEKGGKVGEWEGIASAVYNESSVKCDLKALEHLNLWLEKKYEEMNAVVSNI